MRSGFLVVLVVRIVEERDGVGVWIHIADVEGKLFRYFLGPGGRRDIVLVCLAEGGYGGRCRWNRYMGFGEGRGYGGIGRSKVCEFSMEVMVVSTGFEAFGMRDIDWECGLLLIVIGSVNGQV